MLCLIICKTTLSEVSSSAMMASCSGTAIMFFSQKSLGFRACFPESKCKNYKCMYGKILRKCDSSEGIVPTIAGELFLQLLKSRTWVGDEKDFFFPKASEYLEFSTLECCGGWTSDFILCCNRDTFDLMDNMQESRM